MEKFSLFNALKNIGGESLRGISTDDISGDENKIVTVHNLTKNNKNVIISLVWEIAPSLMTVLKLEKYFNE